MYDVARFWLNRGVAGFRLDAINTLFEDPNLTDNPVKEPGKVNAYGDPILDNVHNHSLPEVHDVLRELRAVLDSYPGHRVLIGETSGNDVAEISAMYGKNLDEIQLPMNFFFAFVNKLSAPEFRKQIAAWDKNPAGGWPVYLFSNHDQVRHYVRYGDGTHNDQIAKLMAAMMFTLRGTPIMYYGEEIGMENNDPQRVEDVKDPIGKIGWPKDKGRDGERTPIQWTAGEHAGFSKVDPWLPVAANYKTHNVAVEEKDPNSILSFYKALIHLRHANDALKNGSYVPVNENDPNMLSYLRKTDNGSVLVALNMSATPQQLKYDVSAQGIKQARAATLLATPPQTGKQVALDAITLPAFGVYIGELR
jgi:alpha-glucosidase